MATWLNHVAIVAPRNGTTTHTVDPNGGTVVAGTNFTVTAGRMLVVVAEGAVTSTTPSGLTLPTNGSAIDQSGLYVWYDLVTSAGQTITTTHNASNYPVIFHFFEFAASSTFVGSVSATAVTESGANPNLTGLTGTNLLMAAKARAVGSGITNVTGAWSGATEIVDTFVAQGATDGYWFGVGYVEDSAASSFQPTCTTTRTGGAALSYEALTWAVNIPAGGTSGTATPAAIVTTAAVGAATPQASKTTAPAVTVATITAPQATAQASKTTAPAAVPLVVTLPAATASGATTGTATPAAVVATITLPAATASGATTGTATPAAVITTATLAQATASASGTAVPGVVVATVTLPAASASGASPGTATPAAVTVTVTLPQAALVAGGAVQAQPVTLTVTMPPATPQASRTATPAVVPLIVAAPAATRSGGSSAQPNAVALVTVTPAPFLVYGYRVNPDAIRLTIAIAAALAQGIEPDQHPITVTMRDRGHTITVAVTGTRTTARQGR